jgi:hypothetical protein
MRLRPRILVLAGLALTGLPLLGQAGFPFQDESLRYSVNWPSGLSLGEAVLSARHSPNQWDFEMTVDAGVPGFTIADRFRSVANQELCSQELQRTISHGSKKLNEKTAFDYAQGKAHRGINGPGPSDLPISACVRDALTFLYYTRRELGQGRVPPHQNLFFGSAYAVWLDYTGPQSLPGKSDVTDRVVVNLKGPASNFSFEILFARDPARTPVWVKIPTVLGAVTLELAK